MFKFVFAIGLGAIMAASPLAALAQTGQPATPAGHTTSHVKHHTPTRSYRSEMRHRSNQSKERARASAEHMRTMQKQ